MNLEKILIKPCEMEDASFMPCSNDAVFFSDDSSGDSDSTGEVLWGLTNCLTNIENIKNQIQTLKRLPRWYFGRLSLPESKKIKSEKNKLWGTMNQYAQYKYYRSKLMGVYTESSCVNYMICYFEQFKSGNIHFHFIVSLTDHIINLKSEFADLFDVGKKEEMKNFFHVQPIDDMNKVFEYLFEKNEHAYENVDQDKFRPIKIISNKIYKTIYTSNDVGP